MNLEFFVRNQKITRKGLTQLVGDTAGFYTFTIDFDEAWDDLVKVVVFRNGTDTAQMIYTGQSPLPAQVSGRGDLYVACHGYRKKGDSVAVLRTIRMTRPVRLLGAAPMAGDSLQQFTPTVFEQVLAAAGDAGRAAAQAETLTAQLRALWEQGAFSASVTIDEVLEGDRASVVNVGTEQQVRLRITLPRGTNGAVGIRYGDQPPAEAHHPLWIHSKDGSVWVWNPLTEAYEPMPTLKGRGVSGLQYSTETGLWSVSYTDGTSETIHGPEQTHGADGGYYVPAVDADGVLTWVASRADMPAAEQATIRGPAGADGKTPVKGTDYFTEADKQEIAQQAAGLVEVPEGFSGNWNDLTDVPSAFIPASHNQAASTITAGTFAGTVAANSSGQAAASYVVRNSKLAAAEEAPTVNGQICWVYE